MPNDLEQFAGGELKEWSLQPNAAVWDAVAERIRKERRRRFVFWWTTAAVLVFTTLGTWVFIQPNESKQPTVAKAHSSHSNQKSDQPKMQSGVDLKISDDDQRKITIQPLVNNDEQVNSQPQSIPIPSRQKNSMLSKQSVKRPSFKINDQNTLNQEDSKHPDYTQNSNTVRTIITTNVQDAQAYVQEVKTDSSARSNLLSNLPLIDSGSDSVQVVMTDSAHKKASSKKKRQWYFTAQVGISDIRPNELLRLAAAQDMQFSGGASPVIGAGNLSGTVVRPGDLQYQADLSFSLGAGITILHKKHWRFSAGLQYRYASMQLITGARVDTAFQAREGRTNAATAVTAFYRPGNGYTYQHQFHLLQLPLVFHVQPFGMEKWRFDAGLLPGVLLGAKALHYNEGNNIFYASNQQYQRLLLNASIGLQYAIPIQKGKKLWVGPHLELGLRNMHQPELSRKAFFQSANLTFTIQ